MLLTACAPMRNQVTRQQTPIPTQAATAIIEPPAYPGRTVTSHESLRQAVESIITTNHQVIAFGEIHKNEVSDLVSTMQYFAREVMPLLAEQGITDLVWEHLPAGATAAAEVEAFGQSQQVGPFLTEWFGYNADLPAVLEVLQQAHALGITLHGCHASSTAEYHANLMNIVSFLNERCLATTQALIEPGRRIAVYAGAHHNNQFPVAGQDHLSFGDELQAQLGNAFVEVDILLPELIPSAEDLLRIDGWQSLAPENGATQLSFASGRQVVILPASLDQ